MWVGRIMLSVCSHWGINMHHRCRGKFGLMPTRPAMRRALPVCMARSAQFRLCIWGGVSCRYMSSSLINCLMGAEHSLSILQYLGWMPLRRRRACTSLNVCRCSAPSSNSSRMKTWTYSYSTPDAQTQLGRKSHTNRQGSSHLRPSGY